MIKLVYAEDKGFSNHHEPNRKPEKRGHTTASAGTHLLQNVQNANRSNESGYGDLLSDEQYSALMSLIKENDCEAKQKVIAHNLRLVFYIARRYADRGVELLYLVREGNLGLIYALENFEVEGGFRFSSYAARCVRRNIERAITERDNSHIHDDSQDYFRVMPPASSVIQLNSAAR